MFVVAIDGPAGSGKGTVAKLISKKIEAVYIDTGAMFRCVALEMLRKNVKIEDEKGVREILDNLKIDFEQTCNSTKVFLNGRDVSKEIRTEEVSNFVSPSSKIPVIREKMLVLQRKMAEEKDVIMEGRDIGTVVFPNANVKVYLDATAEERAKRRTLQNKETGLESDYNTILKDIKIRDARDMEREVAPLKKADDAVYIDSTNLKIDEVVDEILKLINKAKA